MITWLQESLGKHHRTLLGVLLVVIIGSFVFYGYAGARGERTFEGSLPHATATGTIDLTDARSTRDARDLAAFLARSVHTDDFLQVAKGEAFRRQSGDQNDAPRRDTPFGFLVSTVDRLALADALQIPQPGAKELADFIRANRTFAGPSGEFDPALLRQVSELARDRLGLDEVRLQAALGNAWRISRLDAAATPDEAPALAVLSGRLRDTLLTKWTTAAAEFPRAGFSPVIPADETALAAYFETNRETYRIPKRLKLRYARIAGIPPADIGKPTDDDLLATAERRKDKFPLFGSISNSTFLIDNRTPLEACWREEKSGEAAAAKIAESLAANLPLGTGRPDSAALEAMLKTTGLTPVAIPAYGQDSIPTVAGVPAALLSRALELNPQRWRTAAIPYGDGAFIFIYDDVIESRLPALAEVRPRVTADRNQAETERLFAEEATRRVAEITAAVAAGREFAGAAASAGFKPLDIPAFEYRSAPEKIAPHLTVLDTVPLGGISPALASGRDRLVVRVISRTIPAPDRDDALGTSYRRLLGNAAARCTAETIPGAAD